MHAQGKSTPPSTCFLKGLLPCYLPSIHFSKNPPINCAFGIVYLKQGLIMDGMNLRLHDQIDKETCHIISYIAFDWMNMRVDGVRNKRMTMS